MNIIYGISIIYLIVCFLLFRKNDKKISLCSSIVFSLGLLICYNTFIVYLIYLLKIDGSLLLYSIINGLLGTFLLIVNQIKGKGIQKYSLDTKKMVVLFCLGIIIFLIGCFKLRNFDVISFESGDSAVHYRHALEFAENLSILDEENSKDIVFNSFKRTMSISYINCGFLFNIFSGIKSYKVFLYYNVGFLVLSSFVFLITIFDLLKDQKKKYMNVLIISLIYMFAFPLNNFIMGFCYLSLSILVINLLFYTILQFNSDSFSKNIWYKIITILFMTFSCFYSYYQFVPAIYLALGLYYIFLWKNKKIDFKELMLYGVITLIIPFIMGFYYFLVTWVMEKGIDGVTTLIGLWGYCYDNITPMYLYLFLTFYIIFSFIENKRAKKKEKIDYLKLNLYIITVYVLIFFILYITKVTDMYYFYKLFSVYWLCIILYFIKEIINLRKIFYGSFIVICVINIFAYYYNDFGFFQFLRKTNIYTWNTFTMIDSRIIMNKGELELLEKSNDYASICEENNRFLVIGNIEKNMWIYSITSRIPVAVYVEGDYTKVYRYGIPSFDYWEYNNFNYSCVIYYYEGRDKEIDENKYEILYANDAGAIIKRLNKY